MTLFLLNQHFSRKAYRCIILPLLFTVAKSCIPVFWKQTQALPISVWLETITEINELKHLVVTERALCEKLLKKRFYFVYSEDYMALLSSIPSLKN